MRENMGKASNSVRGGLGLPPAASSEGVDEEEQSVSSSFVEEVSEYCPQMTYQQVSLGLALLSLDINTRACFTMIYSYFRTYILFCTARHGIRNLLHGRLPHEFCVA